MSGSPPAIHATRGLAAAELLPEPFITIIGAMPPRDTYASMRRVSFEPGAALSEQPLDGPKLILVESGAVTVHPSRPGTQVMPAGQDARPMKPLSAAADHIIVAGEIAWIPAGEPIKLSNPAVERVTWLQIQLETPATLCACGEDLTGISSELLASETRDDPITGPGYVSLQRVDLAQGEVDPSRMSAYVWLSGAVTTETNGTPDAGDQQSGRDDASTNEVYLFMVVRGAPTT